MLKLYRADSSMKKALISVIALIIGITGFLAYDWHKKTTIQKDDQRVTLYSWTDKKGVKHFTDTQPPDEAGNVEMQRGYQYVDQPLVVKIKNKTIAAYQWAKKRLFKKKDLRKKKRKRRYRLP
jgi:hypothetical protein